MKCTFMYRLFFIVLMQAFAFNALAHVELDNPLGGETYTSGQVVTIEWHIAIPHQQLNWDLLYSLDGGSTWAPIQMDIPVSQLTYQWFVPSNSTTQARISIIQDNEGMDYQDESLNFTISQGVMLPFISSDASDISLECNGASQQSAIQSWLDNHGGATAMGFCGNLIWTNDYFALSNDCGSSGSAFVTFTAADDCGNTSTSATVAIVDTTIPVVQASATDLVIDCAVSDPHITLHNWLNSHGGAQGNDICGSVTWTHNFPTLTDTCNITISIPVTFTARDECGNSNATNATVTFLATTGISNPEMSGLSFELSPNPVTDILQVKFNSFKSLHVDITMIDALGKAVLFLQENSEVIHIPVSEFRPGIYFIQVKTEKGPITRKVVIE
ncbi:MAG TPA: T9SS type A sorting domain-containing protein [Saprospiraceae bacterium]|nr:T9SS type A sorting domain-containing protein [Saprospiraceae bacterium]